MKTLIAEDDFVSRRLMQGLVSSFGECHFAVNGLEAYEAFKLAWDEGKPYDLICLDIMMPEMNGHEVLVKIREWENLNGIGGFDGAKIIMTTALGDHENVRKSFEEQCEAYIVKPIEKMKFFDLLAKLSLIPAK